MGYLDGQDNAQLQKSFSIQIRRNSSHIDIWLRRGRYGNLLHRLKANGKIYYLGVGGGSESSKYAYEVIRVYSITDSTIDNSVKLIKTASGLQNSILVEYDFFSVVDRPDRPIKLIKYDADKKTIYIHIVWENGKVTNKFIRYQFTGQYFEKLSQ